MLSGTKGRDYSYERFWLTFSLVDDDGQPLLPETIREAELVVRIYNKEGRVSWPIPPSHRRTGRNELKIHYPRAPAFAQSLDPCAGSVSNSLNTDNLA